ncbi:MAG: restriction endonuclease subunit S [Candidatus Anstonellales archaeon]
MSPKTKFKQTEIGMIPEDWEVGNFETDLIVRGRIGWRGYKLSDLKNSGPFVLGGENIKSFYYLDFSDVKHISKEKYEESPEIQLKANDVLLVTRGNLGDVGHFKGEYEEVTINPSIVILREFKGDSRFLFYFLISKQGKSLIESIKSGSSVPAIYQSQIRKIRYPKPPLPEQRAIAKVLSAFDDKIELNQRMNKTLEAIGQAIFKHWFVDFEFPNEEGKPYKSSGGEMVYSEELGKEIPKGWKVQNIQDILIFERGIEPGSKYYLTRPSENSVKFIRVGDMSTPGRDQIFIPLDVVKGKFCTEDDILLSLDATLGVVRVGIKGAFSSGIRKVYSKEKEIIPKSYIYWLLKSNYIQNTIYTFANGTTILHAGKSLDYMDLAIPDKNIFSKFSEIAEPLFKKIINNLIEIQYLEQIRDSLLPKLMSGKIRVPLEVRT